jgi:hypothetical protein
MNDVNERKLAEQIHRELHQLPNLKAPNTLGARVLAAIAARQEAPWWKTSWINWPVSMKLAFLVVGIAAVAGLVFAGAAVPQFSVLAAPIMESVDGMLAPLKPYFDAADRLAGYVGLTFGAAGPNLPWYLATLVGVGYATCIGLGTVGYRLVFNKI